MEQRLNISERKYVEETIKNYSGKKVNKLDTLRKLDRKARKSAEIIAYTLGIIGALVLGLGMSISIEELFSLPILVGIIIGTVGIFITGINYPLYRKNLKRGKEKYANQILELSNELLNESK